MEGVEANVGPRCGECGSQVLTLCPSCRAAVRGEPFIFSTDQQWRPADFCWQCGTPYPWAGRQAIVFDIQNRLDEEQGLSEGDRRALLERLDDLMETPDTDAASTRQARALGALRRIAPMTWQAVLPAIQMLVTAKARQELGLPPT